MIILRKKKLYKSKCIIIIINILGVKTIMTKWNKDKFAAKSKTKTLNWTIKYAYRNKWRMIKNCTENGLIPCVNWTNVGQRLNAFFWFLCQISKMNEKLVDV